MPDDILDSSEELAEVLVKVWEVALDSVVMSRVEKLDSKEACPGARLDVELTNSIELKLFVVLLEAAGITILRVPPVTSLTVAETLAPGLLNAALVETAEWASVYVPALEAEDVFMDGAECVSMVVLSDLTTVPILLPLGIILVAFPMTAVVAFVLVLMLVLELTLELMLGVELGVELVFVAELPVVTALKLDEELLLNVSFCVCARTGLTAVVAFVPVPMLVLMLMLELTLELVLGVELELVVVVVVVLELVVVVVVVLVLELELETDDELLLDVVP